MFCSSSSSSSSSSNDDEGSIAKSSLYTGTGDRGKSSLYNMERRYKDDAVFMALGDTDELNSAIGVAREYVCVSDEMELESKLTDIQSRLLDVGSSIATPPRSSNEKRLARTSFEESNVKELEGWIDALDEKVPPLKNFILPVR